MGMTVDAGAMAGEIHAINGMLSKTKSDIANCKSAIGAFVSDSELTGASYTGAKAYFLSYLPTLDAMDGQIDAVEQASREALSTLAACGDLGFGDEALLLEEKKELRERRLQCESMMANAYYTEIINGKPCYVENTGLINACEAEIALIDERLEKIDQVLEQMRSIDGCAAFAGVEADCALLNMAIRYGRGTIGDIHGTEASGFYADGLPSFQEGLADFRARWAAWQERRRIAAEEAAKAPPKDYDQIEADAIAKAEAALNAKKNPSKENLLYQDGPDGTYGAGWEVSLALWGRTSFGGQLTVDRKGNVAFVRYITFGGGTATAGGAGTLTVTEAEAISELAGWGHSTGVAIGPGGVETMGGDGYSGTTYSAGISTTPLEGHSEVTYSVVTDITAEVDALGLRYAVNNLIELADQFSGK